MRSNSRPRFSPNRKRNHVIPKKPGSAPGTIAHVGKKVLNDIIIHIHDYDSTHLTVKKVNKVEDSKSFVNTDAVTWVQVMGLHDTEALKTLWNEFQIHPLVQEDIVNTRQRPKIEAYGDQIFIVLKMIRIENDKIELEQVSIVLSKNFVFSFQESDNPFFDPIKARLQYEKTKLRTEGTDYTAYALMDIIVDYYFTVLEEINTQIDEIEDELLLNVEQNHLNNIHSLRRELIRIRKSIWPLRDSLNSLLRDESPLIKNETKLFFRDVHDHVVQAIDNIDNFREMVTSLHDMYMTNISNKMNEVMKVLTIIATIFIPLTFIAGVYGMNFSYMPELEWKWSYPLVWVLMVIMMAGMIYYFKKKKWF
ncbi:MAG: magnesium/cobalt transporter CorA [Balneolaceae bacterium]